MTAEKESEIIEKYYNEVRNFIKSRMNGDDDFEAVTQETFIIFIRKLRTEKVLSKRGYLYSIAKARIGDYYRQKNKILKHEDRNKDIYHYEKSRDSDNYDADDEENILVYDFENDNTESIEENASIDEDKRSDDYPQNTMLSVPCENIPEEDSNSDIEKLNKKTLSGLNKDEQKLYNLRYIQEKTYKDIAVICNISTGNAKVRVSRLKEKIRKLIKAEFTKN